MRRKAWNELPSQKNNNSDLCKVFSYSPIKETGRIPFFLITNLEQSVPDLLDQIQLFGHNSYFNLLRFGFVYSVFERIFFVHKGKSLIKDNSNNT